MASATFAGVSGGAGTLAVVGLIAWRLREVHDYVLPQFLREVRDEGDAGMVEDKKVEGVAGGNY